MSQPPNRRTAVLAAALAAVLITAPALLASNPAQAAAGEDEKEVTWHPKPLPGPLTTVMQDAKGADATLAAFAGKVLVVNFWATWCAPCIKEMPTLDALQAKLGGPGFQVLAVSQDREGLKVAQPFVEKNGWKNIALYVEPKARFAKDAALRGLPTTIILDQKGQEVGRLEGTIDWAAPKVVESLSKLIAKKPG
jgi:thiol-disulfide isomerase/thioredoxin